MGQLSYSIFIYCTSLKVVHTFILIFQKKKKKILFSNKGEQEMVTYDKWKIWPQLEDNDRKLFT